MKTQHIKILATIAIIIFFILSITIANSKINNYKKYTYDNLENINPVYCSLVLGTSKKLKNGRQNLYYTHRVSAASRLYLSGKCKKIIVSGDNRKKDYNEALDMKNDIIQLGVKESDIICDYAGLRTLDSVIRFRDIFNQHQGIVVSQEFHNNRAIYIARSNGIELYGYNANDVDMYNGFKTRIREILSKFICVLDVEIFKTKPKFLGAKVPV
jgi:SanA protein